MSEETAPKSSLFDVTNTSKLAMRGLGLTNGTTVMFKPGETFTVSLSDAEVAELNGHGWAIVPAAVQADAAADLDSMTVEQLKGFAEANGIDLAGATKKADILTAIEAALTAPAA